MFAGASDATTIICRKGWLMLPSTDKGAMESFPNASSQITRLLNPQDGEAIIIVGADSLRKAEYGILAAAWTLLKN